MTAAILPFRPASTQVRSAGPCGSGTDPQRPTPPCGVTEGSRLFPQGWLCPAHVPVNRKTGLRGAA